MNSDAILGQDARPSPTQSSREYAWMQHRDPAWAAARQRLDEMIYTPRDPVFPVRFRGIVAGLVAAARADAAAEMHFRRAITDGATVDEIAECIILAERPGGDVMLRTAVAALMRVADNCPASAVSSPAATQGLPANPEPGTPFVSANPVTKYPAKILRTFDAAFDDAREAMSAQVTASARHIPLKYHSLITACVLASRFYPSIDQHILRALSAGATVVEIIEAFESASAEGGQPTLHFALYQLMHVIGEFGND
jgi:alkylhydroperoxidase/carboxymuconolactone decarboxylase family protein YurZ